MYVRKHKDFSPNSTSYLQAEHINLVLPLLGHSASTFHVLKIIVLESSSVGWKAAGFGDQTVPRPLYYMPDFFSWHCKAMEDSQKMSQESTDT